MQPTADTRPPTRFPTGTPGATMPPTETDTWRPAEQFKRQPEILISTSRDTRHCTTGGTNDVGVGVVGTGPPSRHVLGVSANRDRAPSAPSAHRFWTTGVASLETKPGSDSSSPVRHLYGPAGSLPAGPTALLLHARARRRSGVPVTVEYHSPLHTEISPPGRQVTRFPLGPTSPHASYSPSGRTVSFAPLSNSITRSPALPASASAITSRTSRTRWGAAASGDSGSKDT